MGRESLIKSTVASSLAWDANRESSVDRVTAIGLSNNSIGSALLHTIALDASSLRKTVLLISRKLHHKRRISLTHGEKIALAVIQEQLIPGCPVCGGRGELRADEKVVAICGSCNGTGRHRYTDTQRAQMVGGRYNEQAYYDAYRIVTESLGAVISASNMRLE